MKRFTTIDGLSLGAIGLTDALTVALYGSLPARVPTHFDLRGVADGFMERRVGAFLLPAFAAAMWLVLRWSPFLLPRAWHERLDASPVDVVAFLVVALFAALQVVVLRVALRGTPSAPASFGVALGVFWAALGLVLPRVRRNRLVGIRTPWSLSSDENWARTHRFGGAAFALGGVAAAFASLAGATGWAFALIVVSGIVPAGYSYLLSRRAVR